MPMTMQEAFDKVVRHLAEQGQQASDEISCLYRTPEGRKCAIGCLIPDDVYSPEMEQVPFATLMNGGPKMDRLRSLFQPFQGGRDAFIDLLGDLQTVHDSMFNWESASDMKRALGVVAEKHHLDRSIIDRVKFKMKGG